VYEYLPPKRVAECVWHIYGLYRNAVNTDESAEMRGARLRFLRSLVNNLQHEQSQLSPRLLAELSRYIPLTIGGTFSLLGYQLDEMGEIDFLLNGYRTRIIESYPFYRDREIDLQGQVFRTEMNSSRNSFCNGKPA
jgi:hypothetical protein